MCKNVFDEMREYYQKQHREDKMQDIFAGIFIAICIGALILDAIF